MDYLVDTVALVRYLRGGRKIGARARQILCEADAGEHIIAISAVTLMEILYLSESRRIPVDLDAVRQLLKRSINYRIVPIDFDVVTTAVSVDDVPELHDRLLVATAKFLNIPILTGDAVIKASHHVQTIWR
jgi:PIN domain nuclease of toxin-antitoxin system